MKILDLRHYNKIGWDFDKTLIEDDASPHFHRFIIENPQIEHYIITFRTHGMEGAVWRHLGRYPDAPDESHFTGGVLNIEDQAWENWNEDQRLRASGRLDGPRTHAETYWGEWKGKTCREHGIPILVDDDTKWVEAGCVKYRVTLVHPWDFE